MKQDHFADELLSVMEMRERRWPGDTLGFVDALSRIPVVIMLKYEKRQLEFWRENCDGEDSSRDFDERRISEVTSLLDGDQASLLESRGSDSSVSVSEHMNIITKSALERRKRRLQEKIEKIKSKSPNSDRGEMSPRRCLDIPDDETGDEPAVSCQNELYVRLDAMSGVELVENDTHDNGDVAPPYNARKRRRRSSSLQR